jgi:hypothetical protein
VYGNVLAEVEGSDNWQFVHYGGDSGREELYRKGTFYLYHNTFVSLRLAETTFIRLTTNDESCDARNNIIYVTAQTGEGKQLELLFGNVGTLVMRNNWMREGFVNSFVTTGNGIVQNINPIIGTGRNPNPGFVDPDFATTLDIQLNRAITPSAPLDDSWPPVNKQYVKHMSFTDRISDDIGAYAWRSVAVPIRTRVPTAPPVPTRFPQSIPVESPTPKPVKPIRKPSCKKRGGTCTVSSNCCSRKCVTRKCK